jgi:dihydrolipoamide dehydrogenase
MNVGLIEKEPVMGGTCLRVGCIPSKALLESSELYWKAGKGLEKHGVSFEGLQLDLEKMMDRKRGVVQTLAKGIEGLIRKNKITRYEGTGKILAPGKVEVSLNDGKSEEVQADRIIIATGSTPTRLPGIEPDGDRIGTSTEALEYDKVPEHLVLIGAGAIGLELGSVWNRLGAKVTVLEYLDRILPGMDAELARLAMRIFQNQGLEFHLNTKVVGASANKKGCRVELAGADPIECDRVLVAVGRVPFTDGLGLEDVGIRTEKGRILVDEDFRTSVDGIYAIGDVIPGPMLAHKAEEDGVACVEKMASGYGHVDYGLVPAIVYTSPEVASVGKTQEQLEDEDIPFRKGIFPFAANGRALAGDHADGRVKILAHAETDRVLGVHIIGHAAGELIAEAAAAMTFGASSEDIARTCHAHPTLAETLKEAALAVDKRAIHS